MSTQEDSFNKENFEFLFKMEQRHFWHVGRREIIYTIIRQIYQDKLSDIKMLEIGCGNGSVLRFLENKGINMTGGDLFMEALQFCRSLTNAPLIQFNALNTPFADNQKDVVGLFDVIEHIDDDEAILKEANRICKPGGRIILTVPANRWLWSYFDIISCHKRRYSKDELYQKLQNAGFIVEKISFYVFFLCPLFFLYRTIGKKKQIPDTAEDLGSMAEVNTIPLINGLFLSTLRIEKLLIKHLDLHIGSSLIAVARKI